MMIIVPEVIPIELPGLMSVTNGEASEQLIRELVCKAQLEPEQMTELQEILQEFQQIFVDWPGRTAVLTYHVELTSSEPVRSKACPVSPRQREIMDAEVKKDVDSRCDPAL